MSICRWSDDSEVYLYESVGGGFVCCICRVQLRRLSDTALAALAIPEVRGTLSEETASSVSMRLATHAAVVLHLLEHREQGDMVPESAFTNIVHHAEGRN